MKHLSNIEISNKIHITYFTEMNLALHTVAFQSTTWNGAIADGWGFFKN